MNITMKKLIICAAIASLTTPVFAADATAKLSTTELKAMDCATLSVEKSNAKQSLESAEKNLSNINAQSQNPAAKVGKWAGVASGALTAFGGGDSKVGKLATAVASTEDKSDANNLELQQKIKSDSEANLKNISIYQKSKKCKI